MTTSPDLCTLQGRVAIVTGASQGAGRGAALALAARGVHVVLAARTAARLEEVASEIDARGGQSLVMAGDIMVQAEREQLVQQAVARFGRIDILINTAQSPQERSGLIDELPDETMALLWESGFVATLKMMRIVKPHMMAAGAGSIVNFGSGGQLKPEGYGIYSAVKAAITTMTRAAAVEWARDGIRANVVLPLVKSPASDLLQEQDPAAYAAGQAAVPLGRFGEPEADIGRVVAFLAGPESSYITGQTFAVNGGLSFLR